MIKVILQHEQEEAQAVGDCLALAWAAPYTE